MPKAKALKIFVFLVGRVNVYQSSGIMAMLSMWCFLKFCFLVEIFLKIFVLVDILKDACYSYDYFLEIESGDAN